MIRQRLAQWFQEERDKLSAMSAKEKWAYIWMYYKWWILGFALAAVILVTGVRDYRYQHRELLISGMFINAPASMEGYEYVGSGYWTHTGGDPDTRVEVVESRSVRFYVEQPTSTDVNAIMSIDALIASQALDYIIGDRDTLEYYDRRGSVLDLETLFSREELSAWDTVETENGIAAVALPPRVRETRLGLQTDPAYLMILVNTPRPEGCRDFIEYLLAAK